MNETCCAIIFDIYTESPFKSYRLIYEMPAFVLVHVLVSVSTSKIGKYTKGYCGEFCRLTVLVHIFWIPITLILREYLFVIRYCRLSSALFLMWSIMWCSFACLANLIRCESSWCDYSLGWLTVSEDDIQYEKTATSVFSRTAVNSFRPTLLSSEFLCQ